MLIQSFRGNQEVCGKSNNRSAFYFYEYLSSFLQCFCQLNIISVFALQSQEDMQAYHLKINQFLVNAAWRST